MKKLILISILGIFSITANATSYYVDLNLGSDTSNGLFQLPGVSPDGPLATINAAIALAVDGDTIYISEGVYAEQLTISKKLTILGINYSNKPISTDRGAETVLVPQLVDVSAGPATNNVQVYILSGDVKIDGLKLDGNNPLLVSGENIFGVDVDLSYGFVVRGDVTKVVLQNNVVTNYFYDLHYFWGGSTVSAGNTCNNNFLYNCGGKAVYSESDLYFDIDDNMGESFPNAITITNFNLTTTNTLNIRNNMLYANNNGLVIENNNASGKINIQSNVFRSGNNNAGFVGVTINNNAAAVGISFNSNVITGGQTGVEITNTFNKHIQFNNDSISMSSYGIWFVNTQTAVRNDTVSLNGVRLFRITEDAVKLHTDNYNLLLRTQNTKIYKAKNGLLLEGLTNWTPFNCSFDSVSAFYIRLDSASNGKRPTIDIAATSCTFEGITGAAMTNARSFEVEDKIHHYLDDNTLGFITVKPQNIYITLIDGNYWIGPAFSKAADGWHVHIKPVVCPEGINVTKNITFHTYGYTEIGMFYMVAPGKTLTLSGDVHCAQGVTLNNGIIKSSVGNGLHLREFAKAIGGNTQSYVDGIMYRKGYGNGTDTLYFPIGKNADFRPSTVTINYTQNSGVVEYSNEVLNSALAFTTKPADVKNVSATRHWDVKVYNAAFIGNITYGLSYGSAFSDDQVTDPSNLTVVGLFGNILLDLGGNAVGSPNGYIVSSNGISQLSKVTIANKNGGYNLLGSNGPIAAFNGQNVCLGSDAIFISNSTDPYSSLSSWRWDFGVPSISDDTATGLSVNYIYPDTGTFNVRLIVKNVFGQSDTLFRKVTVADNPVVSFDFISNCYPDLVNFNGTASVQMGGIAKYEWRLDAFSFNTEDVNFAFGVPGTYDAWFKVTSGFGCTDSFYSSVLYDALPSVSLIPGGISHICQGDTLTLASANAHLKYEWSNGSNGTSIKAGSTGEVWLKGYSSNNCWAADTAFVNVVPLPIVDAGNDTIIYTGTRALLNAKGATTYKWWPAKTLSDSLVFNPVAKPSEETVYYVEGTDDYGCTGVDSIRIKLLFPQTIKVPNLVTPNGDGHNDKWDLRDVPGIDNSKVTILDRWGSVIYESPANGYKHDWAGKRLNIEYPDGTYYYIIELKDFNQTVKGALMLVR